MSLDICAYSDNIKDALKDSYPKTYIALNRKPKEVLLYLKSKNAISGKYSRSVYKFKNSNSEDNYKAWSEYEEHVEDYLKKQNNDWRLNKARTTIAKKIVSEHLNKYPNDTICLQNIGNCYYEKSTKYHKMSLKIKHSQHRK